MKKILITLSTLLLTTAIYSQSQLDTVRVRNIQLKGEEWWWGIDGINMNSLDSVTKKQFKKLVRYLEDQDMSSSQNVNVDSLLTGPFAMIFFTDYWKHPEARENMGQGIDTKLRAYAPLAPYIANADAQRLARFTERKKRGRDTTD